MDYRYGSHTVYNIEYHFVWVTKYRYRVLTGDVALRVREMVRQTCELFEIKILQGVVSKDHVHIRDGARISGTSLRARSARQFSHGVITTGL